MNVRKLAHTVAAFCIYSLLCIILCINITAQESLHWYCKRTQDHTQPGIDPNMAWIADCNGVYVDTAHTKTEDDKVVYLTFDAGYENGNVAKILDVMREEDNWYSLRGNG